LAVSECDPRPDFAILTGKEDSMHAFDLRLGLILLLLVPALPACGLFGTSGPVFHFSSSGQDWWGPSDATGAGYDTHSPYFAQDVPPADVDFTCAPPSTTPSTGTHLAPISGGTLALYADGATAVAADSQRDVLWFVSAKPPFAFLGQLQLAAHAEPGRIAMGPPPLAFVALRGTGDVATVDIETRQIVETRHVCAEPRGLAFDATATQLIVACGEGEVVALNASGLPELKRTFVARDLRDVVLQADGIWVSTFRTPGVWRLGANGPEAVMTNPQMQSTQIGTQTLSMQPHVAWRMIGLPSGGVILSHQLHLVGEIPSPPFAYYGGNPFNPAGTVRGTVTTVQTSGLVEHGTPMSTIGMPVDLALSPSGTAFAVADPSLSTVLIRPLPGLPEGTPAPPSSAVAVPDPVAVAYTPAGLLVVQSASIGGLRFFKSGANGALILAADVPFPTEKLADSGFTLFHTATSAGIACAHCHPEGRDDGHTWSFANEIPLRTQALTGGLLQTTPLHWDGQFCNLTDLMPLVFQQRMGGQQLWPSEVDALGAWLNALPSPAPQPGLDPAQVAAGKVLFEGHLCATCHSGPHLTDGKNYDVGTGSNLQVPSLNGVSARLPVMHSGCAHNLAERFDPACGGTAHGDTATLSGAEIAALVAYLSSL
jgi:hypothetical protein